MRFHARVGILPHERELSQPIEIDATVWHVANDVSQPARAPYDYRELHGAVCEAMSKEPIDFLESIVSDIAQRVLVNSGVLRVRIVARKPHVALGSDLAGAEVALELSRDA